MAPMSSAETIRRWSRGAPEGSHTNHEDDSGQTRVAVSTPVVTKTLGNREGPEFVSIPVWCSRVDCSRDTGYRLARRGEIPGQFRIGTLLRVNWDVFVRSTESERDWRTA